MTVLAVLLSAAAAPACNVPVFRYALEKWPADPYALYVLHRGGLSPGDAAIVQALQKLSAGDAPDANFTLDEINLDSRPAGQVRKLLARLPKAELPLLLVRYPDACAIEGDLWAGPLRADAARLLVDSPARREVARRLTRGDSAVWVLLESGDKARDDAAARLLGAELVKLERGLKLPRLTDDPEDQVNERLPLKITFSLLRLARTDPAEQMFVRMLLHSEEGLAGRAEPMVFPVYGRGRALYALVGAGITRDTVAEAATRLVGPCTCKVKEQYPGVDLLMTAKWDDLLTGRLVKEEAPPPPLAGLATFASPTVRQPQRPAPAPSGSAAVAVPAQAEGSPEGAPVSLGVSVPLAVLAGLAVLAVATFVVLGRGRARS
jgi:hypothetical protein